MYGVTHCVSLRVLWPFTWGKVYNGACLLKYVIKWPVYKQKLVWLVINQPMLTSFDQYVDILQSNTKTYMGHNLKPWILLLDYFTAWSEARDLFSFCFSSLSNNEKYVWITFWRVNTFLIRKKNESFTVFPWKSSDLLSFLILSFPWPQTVISSLFQTLSSLGSMVGPSKSPIILTHPF